MGKKSRTPKNKTKPKKSPSVVSTAAADVSNNIPPPGAACWICLCEDPDDQGKPIVRDCSCRGNNAGFAHLSCLVDYARMKSAEVERGEGVFAIESPWETCPCCHQKYQRQLAFDMANSLLSYIDCRYPGSNIKKLAAWPIIITAVLTMDYSGSPELRARGKRAAFSAIAAIENSNDTHNDALYQKMKMHIFINLAKFYKADKSQDGYRMALHCSSTVRDWFKSEGDEEQARETELFMDLINSQRDRQAGGGGSARVDEALITSFRISYARALAENPHSRTTLNRGMTLTEGLGSSGVHRLEAERQACRMLKLSRLLHGQEHETSKKCARTVDLCRQRPVMLEIDGDTVEFLAQHYDDDRNEYLLWSLARNPWEEQTSLYVPIDDAILLPGLPVVCCGLKSSAHLNGSIGEAYFLYNSTGRYKVCFEDKSKKAVSVRPQNLRILFEIGDM